MKYIQAQSATLSTKYKTSASSSLAEFNDLRDSERRDCRVDRRLRQWERKLGGENVQSFDESLREEDQLQSYHRRIAARSSVLWFLFLHRLVRL